MQKETKTDTAPSTAPSTLFKSRDLIGNTNAQKHSDLVICEIVALREMYGIGFQQISRLTGVPKTTVRNYIDGDRMKGLISSDEFQAKLQELKSVMSKYPPASSKQVHESKAKMRERLRKERRELLQIDSIPHTPKPSAMAEAVARAEVQQQWQAERVREATGVSNEQPAETPAQERRRLAQAQMQEREARLKRAGVPASAPRHVQQRYW